MAGGPLQLPGDPDHSYDPAIHPGGGGNPGGGGIPGFTSFTGIGAGSPWGTAPGGMGITPYARQQASPMAGGAAWGAPAAPLSPGPHNGGVADLISHNSGMFGFKKQAAPTPASPTMPGTGDGRVGYQQGYGGNDNGFLQQIYALLNGFGGQGAFSPGGSQAFMNASQQHARQQADALQAQAMNAANLYGMDPGQQAATRLQAMMGADRGVADLMGSANYGLQMNQQQLAEQLLQQMLGFNTGMYGADRGYQHQSLLQPPGQGQNYGGALGGLGTLLGGIAAF